MTSDVLQVRDRARFVPPTPAAAIIERPALDELYAASTTKVVRVLAPGGYGKSTLVSRWMNSEDRSVLWLDAEGVDNDPEAFADVLVGALAMVDPFPFATLPLAPTSTHWFRERVVPAIGRAISEIDTAFVLVIDDVHEIENSDAAAILDAIAENLPPESTLVLSGRAHRVDDSIARLRLNPGVVDIDATMLALTKAQSLGFLLHLGVGAEHAEQVPLEQFDGWLAGLQLAGLVLKAGDATGQLESISKSTTIVDYLRAEWTGSLRGDHLRFLREVACLGRFTAEMCSEVLDRVGTTATIRQIERGDQLVLPLDRRGEWFRMHPILADWLESELRDADPSRWVEVHRRAADWWERHGDVDLAFDHAAKVGDHDRCEQLVVVNGAAHFPLGGHATVRRWLERLPEERVRGSAELSALATMAALQLGDDDRARGWNLNLSNLVGPISADRDATNEAAMVAEVLRAIVEVRPTVELLDAVGRARRHLPVGPWQVCAYWVEAAHLFMRGDDRCVELWEEGALQAELVNARLLVAHCLSGSALAHDLAGDSAAARERGRRARTIIDETRARLFPQVALALATSALVQARDGRRDDAADDMAISRRQLEGFRSVTPWFNTLTRIALACTAVLIDDRPAARSLLGEAEYHARLPGDAVGAIDTIESLRRQVETASSLSQGRTAALTPAERRVLVHLPTNLSLSDIATRLYVSRNTVKSHAAAIYRKFGTTSRGEAVDLARQAGMLDDRDTETLL